MQISKNKVRLRYDSYFFQKDGPPVFGRNSWPIALLILLTMTAYRPPEITAQVVVELTTSLDPIPTEVAGISIRSWSLFLICEPSWILQRDPERLLRLYWRFLDLGQALGPEHAAVWFWTRNPDLPGNGEIQTAIDVVRSLAFCSQLELSPTEGPFLLVTTDYPGPGLVSDLPNTFQIPRNRAILRLPDPQTADFESLMENVLEAVYSGDLRNLDGGTESFWRAWQSVFQSVQAGVTGAASRINVTIRTVFFEVTID